VCFFYNPTHFDNYDNFQDIDNKINDAGGLNNLGDHTMGDFYSHSNYVDIWYNLSIAGIVSGEMPLYDEIDWNTAFGKFVMAFLKTCAYPDENDPIRGHDYGTDFKNKDYLGTTSREKSLYSLALDAYKRELQKKYGNTNQQASNNVYNINDFIRSDYNLRGFKAKKTINGVEIPD